MKLVENVAWQTEVIDGSPVRLGYMDISAPADVDFTHIAITHDINAGEPDYVKDIVKEADVVILEMAGWGKDNVRRLQEASNGSYTALKDLRENIELGKLEDTDTWEYNEIAYLQLYGCGARIAIADFPKGHPKIAKFARVARSGQDGEEAYQLFAERDRYMLGAIVEKIAELRKAIPDIAAKRPLRLVAMMGAGHYAVHDALAAAALEQGVDSFDSRLLFEESRDFETEITSVNEAGSNTQRMIGYQNWLRTPED